MEDKNIKAKTNNIFKSYLPSVILGLFIVVVLNKFVFFSINVPTESMFPTIKPGDRIITLRIHNESSIKRGDIIVFYSAEMKEVLIKRVIGLPGETVSVKSDGSVYINGGILNEPYVSSKSNKEKEFKVPSDSYLFMGDNRGNSFDSRYWVNPYIKYADISGKASLRYFPINNMANLK